MAATPYGDETRIRIAGPAGLGIKAAGSLLAGVFARAGLHVFALTEYPSLIKGGHNTVHLRVGVEPVHSHVMPTDVLVALDRASVDHHLAELTQGAVILFDSDEFDLGVEDVAGRSDLCLTGLPLTSYIREASGEKIMRNVAALGAVLALAQHPLDALTGALEKQFAHKAPEVAQKNVAVARRAYDAVLERACGLQFRLPALTSGERLVVLDGNEAVGLGALAAGVGFYAAYPMTPASSLLHFMAAHGEDQGVVVKHAEDEIAAMNMVVGAVWGGTRSMCATSGGGFSLMVEALGFAGVSESACVVGLFTRPGPATGMPTWTEQSDLRFAIHASQGEFPRVVLAPGDHQQSFELAWRAFNLADELQTPVIILSDSYAAETVRTVRPFDTADVRIERGKLIADGDIVDHPEASLAGRYARYALTDDGISPRALPGVRGASQLVNSYEHDEYGFGAQGEDAATRVAQNEKRLAKLGVARSLVPPPLRFGAGEGAAVSVVCFGSTTMPVREAVAWLARDGVAVEVLQLVTVWPFPDEEVAEYLDGSSISLCIEGNATGQLEGLVREHCLRRFDERLRRYDGREISPEQIYATIHALLGRTVELTDAGAVTEGGL